MRVWKYVPEHYADDAKKGVLRVGTWASYAALETARGDRNDASVTLHSGNLSGERAWAAMERMGLADEAAPGEQRPYLHVSGNIVRRRSWPRYCFCTSRPDTPYEDDSEGPLACFEIADINQLAFEMQRVACEKLGAFMVHPVKYGQVEFMAEHPLAIPEQNPFYKSLSFAHERELRVVFRVKGETGDQEELPEIEPFNLTADDRVAGLLRRL